MNQPKHIAIIMDGNGRWAEKRGHPRSYGHIKGARVAKSMITACAKRGIQFLTLYTFSIENWKRPQDEVGFLMRLLLRHLHRERNELHKQNIRFRCIGNLLMLPLEIQKEISKTMELTQNNTGMTLTFALSYGSRQELLDMTKRIANEVKSGKLRCEDLNEALINNYLDSSPAPDPDLVIRTSGEYRISNFMLWQLAYSELYFTETYWPDFKTKDLEEAIHSFTSRQRRFGGVKAVERHETISSN